MAGKLVIPNGVPDALRTVVDVLQRVPYFRNLDRGDLVATARCIVERHYLPGEILFLEGEECHGLYIVHSGLVRIYKASADAREQVLRLMGPGDSFNEVPVFDGGPNPASAQAMEPAAVFLLPKRDVQALVRGNPAFAATVVAILASRLRHLVSLVEDLSFRHVTARIAKILLQSARPSEGVGAGAPLRRRLTQQEMAEMAGTAREVVSRAIKALEQVGAIRVDRGQITIVDPEALENWI